MSAPDENHLSEVFGEVGRPPEHAKLPKREIKPWHKPRKQWIRRHQWQKEIEHLCSSLPFKDGRPLRYLSLPGEDLLDVRVVRDYCAKRGIKLKYLGLNEDYSSDAPNTWLHVGCNEINSHDAVVQSSLVIRDRFEQLANESSQAYDYARHYGPFDVVNLDLCSSISPLKVKELNYYAALSSLAKLQARCRAGDEPWLLLVTSRTGGPWVKEDDMKKLAVCVKDNIEAYTEFKSTLEELVPGGSSLASNSETVWTDMKQPDFLNLFTVGLGKWLLRLLSTSRPKWSAKLLDSYSYKIKAETPDMVSLAFLVEPHVEEPFDSTGLSSVENPSTPSSYCEKTLAMKLLAGVKCITDIDTMLQGRADLYEAMEKETMELLLSARYDSQSVKDGMTRLKKAAGIATC